MERLLFFRPDFILFSSTDEINGGDVFRPPRKGCMRKMGREGEERCRNIEKEKIYDERITYFSWCLFNGGLDLVKWGFLQGTDLVMGG